ncbi:MAG: hypothetical protein HYX76_04370 [Acidobacteria bacterium]|nr:hypothetical protein [Acidobacteriota bacterium]
MSRERAAILKLFGVCWLVYTLHWAPFFIREHFPAVTLAEDGTLNVGRFLGWPDVFQSPRGGAYINNNPGASMLGAVPLVIAQPAVEAVKQWNRTLPVPYVKPSVESRTYRQAILDHQELFLLTVCFVTAAGLMAPVSALAAAAMASVLMRGAPGRRAALTVALVYAFGTPVFLRTTYLNHNLLVAQLGVFGFLVLFGAADERLRMPHVLAAGALAGSAVLCDYSGVISLGTLGLYVLMRASDGDLQGAGSGHRRLRCALVYVVGALPALMALGVYQWSAFGSGVLPAQHYMPASGPTGRGYRGFDWPSLDLVAANFFDPRFGLFVYCPILALGLVAPLVRPVRHRVPRREASLMLGFVLLFVLFSAANQYSRLQWTTGFRYLVPVVPPLLVLSAQVLQAFPRMLAAALVGATAVLNWLVAITNERPLVAVAMAIREGPIYAWARGLDEISRLAFPLAWSVVAMAMTLVAVYTFWRREISCAS